MERFKFSSISAMRFLCSARSRQSRMSPKVSSVAQMKFGFPLLEDMLISFETLSICSTVEFIHNLCNQMFTMHTNCHMNNIANSHHNY